MEVLLAEVEVLLAAAVCARLALRVWRSHVLPLQLKIRLYPCLVLSLLTYGLVSRVLTSAQEEYLEVSHVRQILQIRESGKKTSPKT